MLSTYSSWNSIQRGPRICLTGSVHWDHCLYEYYNLQLRRLRQGQPQGVGPDIWPVYQEGSREEGLLGRAGSRAGRPGGVRMGSFRGGSCSRDCGAAAFDGRRPRVQRRANGNNGPALPGCLASLNQLLPQPRIFRGTGGRYSNPHRLIPGKEVSQIKKEEGTGIKRVNINLEIGLHNAFKAVTAAQGVDMTTVLMEFIQQYVTSQRACRPL